MRIAIGADHAGFHLKEAIVELLGELGQEVHDFGAYNAANVLCLGAGEEQVHGPVSEIVDAFLTTEFEGGRHQRRIDKIKAMEG